MSNTHWLNIKLHPNISYKHKHIYYWYVNDTGNEITTHRIKRKTGFCLGTATYRKAQNGKMILAAVMNGPYHWQAHTFLITI